MFCSIIIPTIGRPTLSKAVNSALNQAFSAQDFEIVIVNDSGQSLPDEDWKDSGRVRIIHTNRRRRSVARNTGAAIAGGRYLLFLDDDDYLLPRALENLWALSRANNAAWLYGGAQLTDRRGNPLIELHHRLQGNCFIQVMTGEWIPLQASLIKAESFFAVGGFEQRIWEGEDVDLCRRILLKESIAGIASNLACIAVGEQGSTSDYKLHPIQSRWAREGILAEPEAFTRMRTSANSSYWYGRITRIYLTSTIWNLQHKRVFTAIGRLLLGAVSVLLAGIHLLSFEYWRALLRPHVGFAYLEGHSKTNERT